MKTTTKVLIAICVFGLIVGLWLGRGLFHKEPDPKAWEPVDLKKANQLSDSAKKYQNQYEKLNLDYLSPIDTTKRGQLRAIIRRNAADSLRKRAAR